MRVIKLRTKAGEQVTAELDGTRLLSLDGLAPRSSRYREQSAAVEIVTEGYRMYALDAFDWAKQVLGLDHIPMAMW